MRMLIAGAVALLSCVDIVAAQSFNTSVFEGQLAAFGVLKSLVPNTLPTFDFSPSSVFSERLSDGNYHLGDIIIHYRQQGVQEWTTADSAGNRSLAIQDLTPAASSDILISDLSSVLPDPAVLNITRTWSEHEGDLLLRFNVTNISPAPLEVGGLGFPIEFNSIFTGQEAADVLQTGSFIDPYIGLDAGYVQVTRLNGTGPNLILTPFTNDTALEAWSFLDEPTGSFDYQTNFFEGFYAWQVYSRALADGEWGGDVDPWNPPTSRVFAPNESRSYALRISLVPHVSEIEDRLYELGRPVAVGIPGYVLPRDNLGSLFLKSTAADAVDFEVIPEGALLIQKKHDVPQAPWHGFTIQPAPGAFGRARVQVIYSDGTTQTVHYWITHESLHVPKLLGAHISQKQWFNDTSDPFGRAPSIMSWDKTAGAIVLQDGTVAVAGLSDEGGAGSYVALAMKQILQPVDEEVELLEAFINGTAMENLQDPTAYGVKMSLFYYEPEEDIPGFTYDSSLNWKWSWNKTRSMSTDRAYNYVWVSALYWGLYKAGRVSPGILTYHSPQWYLQRAYRTAARGVDADTGYSDAGLMGESFWGSLLKDLRTEGMYTEANALETRFRARQADWAQSPAPFGSEQAWDCTGQEGVYFWSQYFNDTATAQRTIQTIHGYDPAIPHWAYNGNARRYWDFMTAGQPSLRKIERQGHHYGSGLNALALLDWYRRGDGSFHDLRVGYGGYLGPLSNIDTEGFASMSFHTFPHLLTWDNYTGDYGPNFLGHVGAAGTYLVEHPEFGWTAFGGNLEHDKYDSVITVHPRDTARRRFFAANIGLFVELEGGQIERVTWAAQTQRLTMRVTPDISGNQNVILYIYLTSGTLSHGRRIELVTGELKALRGGRLVEIPRQGAATLSWEVR